MWMAGMRMRARTTDPCQPVKPLGPLLRPQSFLPSDAPMLCPMHLTKAQTPSKLGQIALKPRISGLCKTGTPPATANTCPVSGALVQAGRVTPFLFAVTPLSGTSVQAGRAIPSLIRCKPFWGPWYRQAEISPLLFVQFHLHPPSSSVLCTGPFAVQGTRGNHRQQQSLVALLQTPTDRLALQV